MQTVPPAPPEERLLAVRLVAQSLRAWHQHRAVGIEHVPASGPVLLAVNHSLATYDILLLCLSIYEQTGRLTRGLGDRALFEGPDGGRLARAIGAVEASPDNGAALLDTGELVMVAPGGMREALRPSDERYHVMWDRRRGFVRLAMRTGAPIVLAACPNADRIYHVYENRLTKLVYKAVRLPVPVARGWGPTLLPRPVKLTHAISEPLHPPSDAWQDDAAVDAWHAELVTRMNALMAEARAIR